MNNVQYEINKFGVVQDIKIVRNTQEKMEEQNDLYEIGKVYVRFLFVSSAFACYNLLNGRKFMGEQVDILFIDFMWARKWKYKKIIFFGRE